MDKKAALALFSVFLFALPGIVSPAEGAEADALSVMQAANVDLKAMWMDIRLESVEFYTIGQERAGARINRQPYRWVAGDSRRLAGASGLTYLFDGSWGEASASGVPRGALQAAVRRAGETWSDDSCLNGQPLSERTWGGGDVTVTDYFTGRGDFGDPFAADVVVGGWDADGPLFSADTVAMSVVFIFVQRDTGEPTDIDGDGHMDVALNEIYFNDNFVWQINAATPAIDVETVALHEFGHALALGHFGSPPVAIMNPVYSGRRHELLAIDHAGLCAVWSRQ